MCTHTYTQAAMHSTHSHFRASSCSITEGDFELIAVGLVNCPHMTKLNIAVNQISGAAVPRLAEALRGMRSLTHLNLSYCSIPTESLVKLLQALHGHPTLHTLKLLGNDPYSGVHARAIGDVFLSIPHLTDLGFSIGQLLLQQQAAVTFHVARNQ
eukprot:m.12190 g.12190  ORF g.12190 m.12190 type:complete len:155 (+) comp5965_c0_seq1:2-466(+)